MTVLEKSRPRGAEAPAPAASIDAGEMREHARQTTNFLKSLAHDARLVILCRLVQAPATVSELEELVGIRQASVSQQLARLRAEGLVEAKRDGRSIRYSIADDRTRRIVKVLYDNFCG